MFKCLRKIRKIRLKVNFILTPLLFPRKHIFKTSENIDISGGPLSLGGSFDLSDVFFLLELKLEIGKMTII